MAVAKTVTKNLPPWAQGFSSKLDLMGIEFLFLEEYRLLDLAKHVQVRDDEELAPKDRIAEFAERMRAGAFFPPAIITADDYIIDGATRELAAAAAGRKHFPVLKLKTMTYAGALASDIERMVTIGGAFNDIHGTSMSFKSKARLIELIADLKGDNVSVTDIANQLELKRELVRTVLTARDGRVKAEELGVSLAKRHLSRTHMVILGTASKNMNAAPFRAFAELMVGTTMSTTEIQSVLNRLNKCDNDEDRMSILAAEKSSRTVNITGQNKRPPIPAQLRQHLGFIINQGSLQDADLLVEGISLKAGQDQYEQMGMAIEILRKAHAKQYLKNQRLLRLEQDASGQVAELIPAFSG
jgi:hypothetical protein